MRNRIAMIGLILTFAPLSAHGELVTWSTGDLGHNIIWAAGDFTVTAELAGVVPLPASMRVKYGLWNSPDVLVDVLVNDELVGSVLADEGYISPGPKYADFDVTGLLVSGVNTIHFTGNHTNDGDYVIGQVGLTYYVPEPATLSLLPLGGLATIRRRRMV